MATRSGSDAVNYVTLLRFGLQTVALGLLLFGLAVFASRLYHAVPRVMVFGLQAWPYPLWRALPAIVPIGAGLCLLRYEKWIVNRVIVPVGLALVRALNEEMAWPATMKRRALFVLSIPLLGVALGAGFDSYVFATRFNWEYGHTAIRVSWHSGHVGASGMLRPHYWTTDPKSWKTPGFEFKHKYLPSWRAPWTFNAHADLTGGKAFGLRIPFWFPAILFTLLIYVAQLPTIRARSRRRRGLCVACGYDLTGNKSGVCPECGEAT